MLWHDWFPSIWLDEQPAPPEAPYDVSAWSLGMQFGVKTEFVKTPIAAFSMERIASTARFVRSAGDGNRSWRFPYSGAFSAMLVNRLLKGGAKLTLTKGDPGGVPYVIAAAKSAAALGTPLNAPRIGIYQSYDPSMDEGWTRWVLDRYHPRCTLRVRRDRQPAG